MSHVVLYQAASALERLIRAYTRTIQSGYDAIINAGGKCDSVATMLNSSPDIREAKVSLQRVYEAMAGTSVVDDGKAEPVTVLYGVYFKGYPEDPTVKPGFMQEHRYHTDVQSWEKSVRDSNRQYQDGEDATPDYEPYEVRPVYVYDAPLPLPKPKKAKEEHGFNSGDLMAAMMRDGAGS